jgi:hypothetical protein
MYSAPPTELKPRKGEPSSLLFEWFSGTPESLEMLQSLTTKLAAGRWYGEMGLNYLLEE